MAGCTIQKETESVTTACNIFAEAKRWKHKSMRNCRTIIAVLGIGFLLSACASPQAVRPAFLTEWKPNLDQVISQLEEIRAATWQQQPTNYNLVNLSTLYDTKLYFLFFDLLALLPESIRGAEIKKQNDWLKKRDKQTTLAYAEYEGGTLASQNASETYIGITKERIAEVERKMKELPTTGSTLLHVPRKK
ncbi:hypothetical protein ACFLS1_04635 [Verrucomicrobiota bacterium]